MDLKSKLVNAHSHPPLYIPLTSAEPNEVSIEVSPTRFDVILVTPSESWEETAALPIRTLSADPSFVFLWVGRGDEEGLEKGRECFAKWGFRRAEDIVWVKTTNGKRRRRENVDGVVAERDEAGASQEATIENDGLGRGGLLASQKEHCLMGIRGTVRRSTDTRFAHCNVDTDVLLWEDTGGELSFCSLRSPRLTVRTRPTTISSLSLHPHRILLPRYTSATNLPFFLAQPSNPPQRVGDSLPSSPSDRYSAFRFEHLSRTIARETRRKRCFTFRSRNRHSSAQVPIEAEQATTRRS